MNLTDKMAYLRGMVDGMELDLTSTKEGKVLGQLLDVMQDLTAYVSDLQTQVDELTEVCDLFDQDLGDLEDIVYDEDDEDDAYYSCDDDDDFDDDDFDDDDDETLYETVCPSCNNVIALSESVLEEGEMPCPCCGEMLEFDYSDLDDDAFEVPIDVPAEDDSAEDSTAVRLYGSAANMYFKQAGGLSACFIRLVRIWGCFRIRDRLRHPAQSMRLHEVKELFQIVEKKKLNDAVVMVRIVAPLIAKKVLPGQFIIFRLDEFGERVPLTVADYDREGGTITLIFQIAGETTRQFSQLEAGDTILDLVGPLGVPTELPEGTKSVCVIGGGVGCAIAYPQAKHLHSLGLEVDTIVGFRNKDIVILEDEFRACSDNLYLCTDDGSYGTKGFVTNVLQQQLEQGKKYDVVIAIGPVPMMKFVCKTTEPFQVKTIVSLNPIMVDGTGMCGGCRVTVGGKTKYACVDGPDFDGHQVDFDELMRRNGTYKRQEQECNLFRKEVQ